MKKIIAYCITLVLFGSSVVYSQIFMNEETFYKKYAAKVIYGSRPYSQDFFELLSDLTLAQSGEKARDEYMSKIDSIQRYYTLYSDFKSNKTIFFLEETEHDVPDYETPTFLYTLKDGDNYRKVERFHGNEVYTKSDKPINYDWKIIEGETKVISTFKCQKAVSNIDGYKIVAWFAIDNKSHPINAPMNIFGLPGMVVFATDYYNSFVLHSIEVRKAMKKQLDAKYEELSDKYEKEKKEVIDGHVFFHQKIKDYKAMKKEMEQQIKDATTEE